MTAPVPHGAEEAVLTSDAALKAEARENRSFRVRMALILLATIGLTALFGINKYRSYYDAIDFGEGKTVLQASTFGQHIKLLFDTSHLAAERVADRFRVRPLVATPDDRQFIGDLANSFAYVRGIAIYDPAGRLAVGTEGGSVLPSVGRSFLDVHADGNSDIAIQAPLHASANDAFLLPLSHIVEGEDGNEFKGIVVLYIDIHYLAEIHRFLEVGRNGNITLLRQDGTVLTRRPLLAGVIGRSYDLSKVFPTYDSPAQTGTQDSLSPVDGIRRIHAFARVPGWDLVTVVGLKHDDVVAGWQRDLWLDIGTGLPVLVLLLWMFGAVIGHQRRRLLDSMRMAEVERRHRTVLDSLHEAVVVSTGAAFASFVNQAAKRLFGLPGRRLRSAPEVLAEHFDCLRPDGTSVTGDWTHLLTWVSGDTPDRIIGLRPAGERDGPVTWLHIATEAIATTEGDRAVTVTSLFDITEAFVARASLAASEARFRAFFEAAFEGLAMTRDGVVMDVNDAFGATFACTEAIGKPITGFLRQGDLSAHAGDDDLPRVVNATRCDGSELMVEVQSRSVTVDGRRYQAFAIRDMTERYRAESELKAAKAHAEEAFRDLQQAQENLVKSEKLASLGGLLAGVAHEINTPVGVALTSASHLDMETKALQRLYDERELTAENLQEYLETAGEASRLLVNNCNRAAEMIRSFKQVAVDQTGNQRRTFALAEYIDEVLLSLRPKLKKTAIKVHVTCPSDLILDTHPGALSHSLTNLLINSLTHAYEPDQAGTITITASQPSPDEVELRYQDDGKGIPFEIQAKVFDPFFTTRRGTGGSGLGLHILYNAVHGGLKGTVIMTSTPGEGTVFVLRFPRVLLA